MLGWDPDEQTFRADWDAAKHPRILHGPHGGQFARVPGGGGPPALAAGDAATQVYQAVGAAADDFEQRGLRDDVVQRLRWAQRAMDAGQDEGWALAAKYVDEAGILADRAGGEGEGDPLRELAAKIRATTPTKPLAAEFKSVQDFTAKGAKVLPGLLGGGREAWDGKITYNPDLGTRAGGTTLAELDWAGHMNMLNSVAKDIGDNLAHEGKLTPFTNLDSFSVPLHELIHGVIGGHEAEQRKAQAEAAKGLRGGDSLTGDAATLMQFHNSDLDQFYASGEPPPYWQTLPEAGQSRPISQKQADWLAAHGWLEKQTGAVDPLYRLTAKGTAALPVDHEQMADGRTAYQQPDVQLIEEGFTELGTIQHAPEFFDALGIGDAPTGMIAAVGGPGKPDPVMKAKLLDDLDYWLRQSGRREFAQAAKALKANDQDTAHDALRQMLGSGVVNDHIVGAMMADLATMFTEHAAANPEYEKRRHAMISAFSYESDQIRNRIYAPAEPGRVASAAELTTLMQAMARAANDIDGYDLNGAAEELGRLMHSGDPALGKDAARLRKQLGDLMATHQSGRATLSEYARRLQNRQRIMDGNAWGHYPQQTAAALMWVEAMAMAEKPPLHGEALLKRERELADEINREGAGGKVDAMARQAIRAAGGTVAPWVVADAIHRNYPQSAALAADIALQAAAGK